MAENDSNKTLETLYWQLYESEMKALSEEIKEYAEYLAYDLNPIGRFKDEYAGFAGNALGEITELEGRLEKMKKLLQGFA